MTTVAQAVFPAGFKLIKGDNLSGEDDMYTNVKDVFRIHTYWRSYEGDYTWNDENYRKFMSESVGYPMYRTKDSLLWGTGKLDGFYSYTVVDWSGEIFELYSKENDADFATYSKWLISSIREYRKKGKKFMFARRLHMVS
ncbi:hypothetical protein [Chitinophaga sancti]|uniref:hypothetical protein n=1 Tax=Chitinophaga sancti TaxID=1004 RepID=UPI003F7A99E6